MRNIVTPIILILLSATLFDAFINPAKSASRKLSGDEIKQIFAGKSFKASGPRWAGNITYASNGKYSGFNSKTKRKFGGSWEIKKNKLCTKLNGSNRTNCETIRETSSNAYKIKSTTFIPK